VRLVANCRSRSLSRPSVARLSKDRSETSLRNFLDVWKTAASLSQRYEVCFFVDRKIDLAACRMDYRGVYCVRGYT